MSDLQWSLIVLALIAIAGIWVFNTLMDRRRTRAFERRIKPQSSPTPPSRAGASDDSQKTDAQPSNRVEPGGRSEPSFEPAFGPSSEPAFEPSRTAFDGVTVSNAFDGIDRLPSRTGEPRFGGDDVLGSLDQPTIVDTRIEPQAAGTMIDDEIHAVVMLEPESPLSGERAWSLLHAFRHAGRQPVMLVGVRGDLQEPIRAGQRYEAVLVAVQLANRSGPINEIEWSEFVAALQHVSEQIPAECEVPDMRETTARARALDAQCVPLDAQIGINLTSTQSGWSGQHVAILARDHGLILRPDGRFHALDENGATLFVLQNGDGGAFRADTLEAQQTSRLTLLLDVPRAPQAQRPFNRLVTLASKLATALDAAIVDDQSRPLSAQALASIGRQIEPVYAKLVAAGMPAGSPRALALFG